MIKKILYLFRPKEPFSRIYNEGEQITITGTRNRELDGSFVVVKAEHPEYVLKKNKND